MRRTTVWHHRATGGISQGSVAVAVSVAVAEAVVWRPAATSISILRGIRPLRHSLLFIVRVRPGQRLSKGSGLGDSYELKTIHEWGRNVTVRELKE